MAEVTKPTPGFWARFADWLHGAEKKVEPEVEQAGHELHALAEQARRHEAMLEALAAHLGPEAVAVLHAAEKAAADVEHATGA